MSPSLDSYLNAYGRIVELQHTIDKSNKEIQTILLEIKEQFLSQEVKVEDIIIKNLYEFLDTKFVDLDSLLSEGEYGIRVPYNIIYQKVDDKILIVGDHVSTVICHSNSDLLSNYLESYPWVYVEDRKELYHKQNFVAKVKSNSVEEVEDYISSNLLSGLKRVFFMGVGGKYEEGDYLIDNLCPEPYISRFNSKGGLEVLEGSFHIHKGRISKRELFDILLKKHEFTFLQDSGRLYNQNIEVGYVDKMDLKLNLKEVLKVEVLDNKEWVRSFFSKHKDDKEISPVENQISGYGNFKYQYRLTKTKPFGSKVEDIFLMEGFNTLGSVQRKEVVIVSSDNSWFEKETIEHWIKDNTHLYKVFQWYEGTVIRVVLFKGQERLASYNGWWK